MTLFLTIIFIISATIKAGNCLMCTECNNSTSPDCTGNLVTCGTCMTTVTEINSKDGNGTSYYVEKTCNLNPTICNITYSVNNDQFQTRYLVHCCDTDLCNKEPLEVTPWNNTKNGLECPACYAANAEDCIANNTAQCTGDESKCIVFSGKAPKDGNCQTVAFQGCVSELWCDHPGYLYPDNAECVNGTTKCSGGTNTNTTTVQ
ncbi:phospholipase A2 inhibitor and Ly6/PLAUR domain-containing protein-like [Dendropsophus ebraccatus]|uniref:phospholipase A2 inhibitor and Ly6/PLAUR domain-containing protein-like n=1 Tax=Dendropsophus ebraccatus TaxID=150705 RepID=UPI0038310FC1